MAEESKNLGKIRTIRVQNETIYLSLPKEVFNNLIGKRFRQNVTPKPNGGWLIDLDPED